MSLEACLPHRSSSRYLDPMRTVLVVLSLLLLTIFCLLAAPADILRAEQPDAGLEPVPIEDYAIYDRVVMDKFLTSQTKLVLIERLTVTRLGPEWPPTSQTLFEDNSFFEGRLPRDLVRDFIVENRRPSRLEARFNFGVGYRFITEEGLEPEVSLVPVPAVFAYSSGRGPCETHKNRPAHHLITHCIEWSNGSPVRKPGTRQAGDPYSSRRGPSHTHGSLTQAAPATVGILGFSRAGFNVKGDQALVYVGDNREDGTGAGFLLWLSRRGQAWEIADTDVLWIARPE